MQKVESGKRLNATLLNGIKRIRLPGKQRERPNESVSEMKWNTGRTAAEQGCSVLESLKKIILLISGTVIEISPGNSKLI